MKPLISRKKLIGIFAIAILLIPCYSLGSAHAYQRSEDRKIAYEEVTEYDARGNVTSRVVNRTPLSVRAPQYVASRTGSAAGRGNPSISAPNRIAPVYDSTGSRVMTVQENIFYAIFILLLIALIAICAYAVRITFRDEAIFFYNGWDVAVNLVSAVVMVVIGCQDNTSADRQVALQNSKEVIVFSILALIIIYNCFMAYRFNRGNLLNIFSIGTARLTIGFLVPVLALFVVIFSPGKRDNESDVAYEIRRQAHKIWAAATLFFLYRFYTRLVNGKRVEENALVVRM